MCGYLLQRASLDDHRNNNCKEMVIDCEYKEYGCYRNTKRKNMDDHLNQDMAVHLQLVKNTCDDLKSKYKTLESRLDACEQKIGQK